VSGHVSRERLAAGVQAIAAVAEAIRGLGEVPSGTLYAHVCGTLSLDAYRRVIGILKRAGLVSEENHLLRWVGPKIGESSDA
jgi:hypothetical protein